jgi:hypothetical protein
MGRSGFAMSHFEQLVEEKLDRILDKVEGLAHVTSDHEDRIRVLERFKYKLAAMGTTAAAAVGAAGGKIAEIFGFHNH